MVRILGLGGSLRDGSASLAALRYALDYVQFFARDEPSFLYGKSVGLIGTGGGTIGAVNVVAQLTQIAHALRAQAVPLLVPITGASRAFEGGELIDPQFRQRLDALARELVTLTARQEVK